MNADKAKTSARNHCRFPIGVNRRLSASNAPNEMWRFILFMTLLLAVGVLLPLALERA